MEARTSMEDDEDTLPYPAPLARSDFVYPSFDASTYLSTLSDRHQTLEDLRSDLRERSQLLGKELLDLVNDNYEAFLNLGRDLKGGEEKIEDVRMGLLGFQRGIQDVKRQVVERRREVEALIREKSQVAAEIELGRRLLETDDRVDDLNVRLLIDSADQEHWSDSESSDDESDEAMTRGPSIDRLQRLTFDFRTAENLHQQLPSDHPMAQDQHTRLMLVRKTLILDVNAALKQALALGEHGKTHITHILMLYRELDAGSESLKLLQEIKGG